VTLLTALQVKTFFHIFIRFANNRLSKKLFPHSYVFLRPLPRAAVYAAAAVDAINIFPH
jgi:hypothetical protein